MLLNVVNLLFAGFYSVHFVYHLLCMLETEDNILSDNFSDQKNKIKLSV